MESVFIREQRRYTQDQLVSLFNYPEEKTVQVLKRLKEYGVLKAVKASDAQKDLSELTAEEIEIADVDMMEYLIFYQPLVTFFMILIKSRLLKLGLQKTLALVKKYYLLSLVV